MLWKAIYIRYIFSRICVDKKNTIWANNNFIFIAPARICFFCCFARTSTNQFGLAYVFIMEVKIIVAIYIFWDV